MAYYFAVETKENNYVAINVKKSGYFGKKTVHPEDYQCTLEEIDSYTMKFMNEERLKNCLLSEKILSANDSDRPLAIIYSDGIEHRVMKGKVLYKESQNFKENPQLIIEYMQSKYRDNDYIFFKTIAEIFSENTTIKGLFEEASFAIENSLLQEETTSSLNEAPISMIIEDIKRLIYAYHTSERKNMAKTDITDYENLHIIISFISDYEESIRKSQNPNHTKEKKPH